MGYGTMVRYGKDTVWWDTIRGGGYTNKVYGING